MLRELRYNDIGRIVQELRHLPEQSGVFADVADDVPYVESKLKELLDDGVLMGAVDAANSSFIFAAKVVPWYANRIEIHEMILWVPERYRGSGVAYRLIRKFTELAMDESPHSIHVGASLDITSADRTLMLYERAGYTRQGTGAIMRL